jgi:hypothetical protein
VRVRLRRKPLFTSAVILLIIVLFSVVVPGCNAPAIPSPTLTLPPPSITTSEEPIEVVSAVGPLPSWYEDGKPVYNPGGPIVEITLKNVSDEPVIFLEAALDLNAPNPQNPYTFTFDVTFSRPLLPGKSISARQILIGGGFGDEIPYPVTINGTLQSNVAFFYTKPVLIKQPAD